MPWLPSYWFNTLRPSALAIAPWNRAVLPETLSWDTTELINHGNGSWIKSHGKITEDLFGRPVVRIRTIAASFEIELAGYRMSATGRGRLPEEVVGRAKFRP